MRQEARSQVATRTFRKRGLVVTEGTVTEPEYFELLKQELARSATFVHVKTVGVGKDPYQVFEKCVELRDAAELKGNPYDWSCCVVDVDTHTTLDACIKAASSAGVHVVVSNVKFEVWLLWHVKDKRGSQSGEELDRLMRKHSITDGKHLLPRFPVANYERALTIARAVDSTLASCRKGRNPSTSMPVLIDLMR